MIGSPHALSLDGTSMGPLIAHSVAPLVSMAECASVLEECEARARGRGGWTTQRHENYPTTDVPVQQVSVIV